MAFTTTIGEGYRFIEGEPIKVGLTFTNEITGALTNPDTVKLVIQRAGSDPVIITLPDLTAVSDGIFYYIFDTTNGAGNYTTQVRSTGALVTTSLPTVFTVLPTLVDLS